VIRCDAWQEYSRGSLWLMPMVSVVLALLLGALLSRINVPPTSPLAFQETADDARALLIAISSTMVTVIALLLGLAVVALQLSSTQFSPRLLRNFLRDRPNQIVLSVFVGTFAYSTGGLFEVGVSAGQRSDTYPRFGVTCAVALLFVSLALLVFFADHLAESIQVDHIMRVVERTTLPVIRDLPATVATCTTAELRPCRTQRYSFPPGRPATCRSYTSISCWGQRRAGGARAYAAADRRACRRWSPLGPGTGRPRRTPRLLPWPLTGVSTTRCGSASNAPSNKTPGWVCASSSISPVRRFPRRASAAKRSRRPTSARRALSAGSRDGAG
jgi:hypothetical protein